MSGFQIHQSDRLGSACTRTCIHPRVYKTRWGAMLGLVWHHDWYFGDTWTIVPVEEKREEPSKVQMGYINVPRRKPTSMAEMFERARWKCERCGKVNEWGTPTCPCNHKR